MATIKFSVTGNIRLILVPRAKYFYLQTTVVYVDQSISSYIDFTHNTLTLYDVDLPHLTACRKLNLFNLFGWSHLIDAAHVKTDGESICVLSKLT